MAANFFETTTLWPGQIGVVIKIPIKFQIVKVPKKYCTTFDARELFFPALVPKNVYKKKMSMQQRKHPDFVGLPAEKTPEDWMFPWKISGRLRYKTQTTSTPNMSAMKPHPTPSFCSTNLQKTESNAATPHSMCRAASIKRVRVFLVDISTDTYIHTWPCSVRWRKMENRRVSIF